MPCKTIALATVDRRCAAPVAGYRAMRPRGKRTLQSAADKGLPIALAMFHFPPFDEKQAPNEITALLHEYGVQRVVYGHLHGKSLQHAFEGTLDGIQYELVSCDHLNFAPKLILP